MLRAQRSPLRDPAPALRSLRHASDPAVLSLDTRQLRSDGRSSRTAEDSVPSAMLRSRAVPRLAGRIVRRLARPLGRADDLTRIKGVGPKMQAKLNALGVFHFWQLASLSKMATCRGVATKRPQRPC